MSNVSPFYNLKGLAKGAPTPVVSNVAPTANNKGFALGTLWVDQVTNSVYVLAGFNSAGAIWTASVAGSGAITATSIVDTGDLDLSDSTGAVTFGSNPTPVNVTQVGDYNITGDITQVGDVAQTGNSVITGDLTVTGTFTNSGAGPIHLVSSDDVAEAIFLEADGGILATIVIENTLGTNAGAIKLLADAGGIQIQTPADHINLSADTATMDLGGDALVVACDGGAGKDITFTNTAGSFSVNAGESVADAIVINASGAAGGIQLEAGTGGILIGNQATASPLDFGNIAPTATRNINIGSGTVVTAAVTDTVNLGVGGATTNANSIKTVNVGSGNVTTGQNIVNINSGTAASGTQTTNIASGTGGGTKVVNIGNADSLTTVNTSGIVNINAGAQTGNIHIGDGTGSGTIGIGNSLSGAMALTTGSTFHMDAADLSYVKVTGAGKDMNVQSVGGSVNILADEAIADAIVLTASGGGIETSSVLQTLISSSQAAADAIKLNSSAGGVTVSSASTIAMTAATPIVLTSTQASGTAIQITSSNASGGVLVNTGGGVIALSSSGNVSMVAETATAASPTAIVEIDARVGTATFTGYTTASMAVQKFTITNMVSTTSKACFATATHTGAGDAQLTVGAQCLNGSMVFTVTNVGLAAVNGPILLSFWIIN